jgi:serine/threonine protein kinase
MVDAVKRDSGDSVGEFHQGGALADREGRICPDCGAKFSVTSEIGCPVCALRGAAGGERGEKSEATDSLIPASESGSDEPKPPRMATRFENYELARGKDGTPIELGRGAMGITYKAFDVELRCPVTLKVISERYLDDESARLRFLREARAAASLRHPNVASVFHLGKSGGNYFYAMEFVEGETLGHLIKRRGRLEVKLALEITNQVAVGMAALHKKKLVHRDIKPNNIMVSLEEEGAVSAKIIDLGLAKAVHGAGSQTAISTPGAFAGTPEFASPEQFAGVGVDIRSDLYSLGITLWQMLTGRTPFRGTPAEVMYQHLYVPAPLEQLKGVPQPVMVLLEVLVEKDPGQRFQNPAELLKVIPTIAGAFEARRKIRRQSLQETLPAQSRTKTYRPPARLGPKKISVARLPVTGSDLFGRVEDIAFLDSAWTSQHVNVVTIAAWAGVGKSTLVNHWLRRMAAEHYRSAELVFGWSFYRQGSTEGTSSADEFLDVALRWFGDPDPRIGTAWQKGERLAKLVAHRRTLLVLDGLEPLQNPPGPQEGRLREPCLQSLLRELAAFNRGLCVITTRMPVADIADHERTSALRRDLERLSNDAGALLLKALGAKGTEADLRSASDEFSGHCLALTLLGSYLADAYSGDIRLRKEVSARLADDVRQGAHARKVMESYQTWFGEGPELSVLRMLGLFDRPADENALDVLLKSPAIPGLTESLTGLTATERRTILAKLRRARLLAGEDPNDPGQLDTHPLVREYFGQQLRSQQSDAWKECNRRLYNYYRTQAPRLPDTLREMEPLFLAVICGCEAGLLLKALREVYIPRIQRGDANFAAKVLGARGALLRVLVHFFERGRLASPFRTGVEGQELTPEDHLFILMQAAQYLTDTGGFGASEARACYERVEFLCHSLDRPLVLFSALNGQWRYSLVTDTQSATLQIARRIHTLAQEQEDSALMIGAYRALAVPLYYSGDFEGARQNAASGVQIWRSGAVPPETAAIKFPLGHPVVACLNYQALSEWHLEGSTSYQATMAEATLLAKELNDMHALAMAEWHSAFLAYFERNPTEVERYGKDLIELSARYNFAYWLAAGVILRGWARSASGDAGGIPLIEDGVETYLVTGSRIGLPFFLALKAEALHLADRTSEALRVIVEAKLLVEKFGERWWYAELHRLSGVFLATIRADDAQIKASFSEAIKTAKEQKSISLAKRAEASYVEYYGRNANC